LEKYYDSLLTEDQRQYVSNNVYGRELINILL